MTSSKYIEYLQTEVEGQLSSKEENFRVTQKKNIKKSWEINDIKGFVSFRVKRGIFE
ncbi:hypothetical protein ML436_11265 [Staphylococcus roterodami]|nr:hypothetical protein ML436_11265 [Staphylococcus roterodami]